MSELIRRVTIHPKELGARLRAAREAVRLKQEDVARRLGVSRPTVAQMELGNRAVASLELDRLAHLYGRDIREFLAPTFQRVDSLVALFRGDPEVSDQGEVLEALRQCLALGREVTTLEKRLGIEPDLITTVTYSLPSPRTRWDAVQQGERIASEERRRLGLGEARLPSVTELLGAQGVRTAQLDLPDDVSGLTLLERDTGVLVVANRRHPFSRRRFSYAHEYCHVLLDREQKSTISRASRREDLLEVRANAFAASLLLPVGGVRRYVRSLAKGRPSRLQANVFDEEAVLAAEARTAPGSQAIQMHDVVLLAHHFAVSRQSVLYRLRNLRLISASELDSLRKQEEQGLGRELVRFLGVAESDHDEARGELLHRFLALGLEAFRRGEVTEAKLGELCAMAGAPKRELRRVLQRTGIVEGEQTTGVRRRTKGDTTGYD